MAKATKTAGFVLPDDVGVLNFDETPYAGARVEVRLDLPLKFYLRLDELQQEGGAAEVFKEFGDVALVSWNLEGGDGNPIPASGEGMMSVSPRFARVVLDCWRDAVAGLDTPLGDSSSNMAKDSDLNLGDFSRPS